MNHNGKLIKVKAIMKMKDEMIEKNHLSVVSTVFVLLLLLSCSAQDMNKSIKASLKLIHTVSLQNVKGRIDHLEFNSKLNIAYVAALGNNTVEAVDLRNLKIVHTIKGLSEPQGICFISAGNSLFIANGSSGICDVFDAGSYKKLTSISLGSDADNVRYDPLSNRVYVGYGDGAIAVIDVSKFRKLAEIKLPAHPESFQLDDKRIYVNVPEAHEIDVINLERSSVETKWKIKDASSNFPMALDKVNHRLFIGCRHPAKLLVVDTENGKTVASLNIDSDTDDLNYDSSSKQLLVSCGSGKVDIIKQIDQNKYKIISVINTRSGARTSLFIPELKQLIVAAPAITGKEAELLIYGNN